MTIWTLSKKSSKDAMLNIINHWELNANKFPNVGDNYYFGKMIASVSGMKK